MSKIHMLDEAGTARAKRVYFPKTHNARRQAWCGAVEKTKPMMETLIFAHPDECEDVTCQECVELLRLAPWAGRTV